MGKAHINSMLANDRIRLRGWPQLANIWFSRVLFTMLVSAFCLSSVTVTAQTADLVQPLSSNLPADNSNEVGEVSLVLGRAYVERGDARLKVSAGSSIRVGDRIFTEAGSHVHVRFIDDALVSVRQRSTLDIVRYDYDSSKPEHSAVKFELREGVARAISGDAAKSARQRFRMNTPIAAIGVRGTDFVISADSISTRALVNEGAITMAPFSNECSSESLGPCAVDAIELTENNLQVVELGGGSAQGPRVIASQRERALRELNDNSAAEANASDAQVAGNGPSESLETNEVYLESVANEKINNEIVSAADVSNQQPEVVVVDVIPEVTPEIETEIVLIDFTPQVALTAESTRESQLVWGRWASEGSASLMALGLSEARADRDVTISSPSGFLLYRSEPNGARLESGLGLVKFNLSMAEAFYDSNSGVVAMRVADGNLEINFVDRAFSTELNLDHITTGEINFVANGKIADGGYLISREGSQVLTGAAATDGSGAAYFFEQQLEAGNIHGITLWGAQ